MSRPVPRLSLSLTLTLFGFVVPFMAERASAGDLHPPHVRVRAEVSPTVTSPGSDAVLAVTVSLPSGFVTFDTEQVSGSVMPTRITLEPSRYYVPLESFESPTAEESRDPQYNGRIVRYFAGSPTFRRRLLLRDTRRVDAIPITGRVDCLVLDKATGRSYLLTGLTFSTSVGLRRESETLKVPPSPTVTAELTRTEHEDRAQLFLEAQVPSGMALIPAGRNRGNGIAPTRILIEHLEGLEVVGPLTVIQNRTGSSGSRITGPGQVVWSQRFRVIPDVPTASLAGRILFSLDGPGGPSTIEQSFEARLSPKNVTAPQPTPIEKAVVPPATETTSASPKNVASRDPEAQVIGAPAGDEISTVDFGAAFRQTRAKPTWSDIGQSIALWVGLPLLVAGISWLFFSRRAQRLLDHVIS